MEGLGDGSLKNFIFRLQMENNEILKMILAELKSVKGDMKSVKDKVETIKDDLMNIYENVNAMK
ncbi:hypothetical protein CULT_1900006 [[Clostridium] ultunense Esp]|nr:hypothetical protein CULT_1900006 [[Clostridium] ultunense Esp]